MTTNTLAAIRERFERYNADWHALDYMTTGSQIAYETEQRLSDASERFPADVSALLAIVDELTRKLEAAEADYRTLAAQVHKIRYAGDVQIDGEEIRYGLHCEWSQVRLTALMAVGTLATIEAADALAAHAANGESAGNGGA